MLRTLTNSFFLIGFLLGVLSCVLLKITLSKPKNSLDSCLKTADLTHLVKNTNYEKWFQEEGLKRTYIPMDVIRYSNKTIKLESQVLHDKVKIACLIFVKVEKNGRAANDTWAQQCNDVIFINMLNEKKKMPVRKTKDMSNWSLLCKTFLNIDTETFDWFLIVNDTTFVIIENLRLLVAGLNANEGYYLGHPTTFWSINYNVGLAGYVLSRKTLQLLKEKFNTTRSCVAETTYLNQEDFYLGKNLASMHIYPKDTRDALGFSRFHSFNWQHELFPQVNYYKSSLYPTVCCSDDSITFNAIEADKMYMYYYILYHLEVFKGGHFGSRPYASNEPDEMVMQRFLLERGYNSTNISAGQYYKIWEELVHDPTEFAREVALHKYEYYD